MSTHNDYNRFNAPEDGSAPWGVTGSAVPQNTTLNRAFGGFKTRTALTALLLLAPIVAHSMSVPAAPALKR